MNKVSKVSFADKFHRGFVWTCIGMTGLAALNLVLRGYEYVVYVRPMRKIEEGKIEEELLREGTPLTTPAAAEQLAA